MSPISPDNVEGIVYVQDTCGRCAGYGRLQVIEAGGRTGTTWCPICKGSGRARYLQSTGDPNRALPSTSARRYADGSRASTPRSTRARR